jgi:hypothetical protein
MKKMAAPGQASEATEAPLPAERAFVVQLRAQHDLSGNLFIGRVEHIASGAAERFGSAEELIAFITKVLTSSQGELSASSAKEEKTA